MSDALVPISGLTSMGGADAEGTDVLVIVDVTDLSQAATGSTKKMTLAAFRTMLLAATVAGFAATDVLNALTVNATSVVASGSISGGAASFTTGAFSSTTTNAFGGAGTAGTLLKLTGTVAASGSANSQGLLINPTLQNPSGSDSFGLIISPTIATFTSGTHADFATAKFIGFTGTANGATVTNGTTVLIDAAPDIGTNKRALWVVAGATLFGGTTTSTGDLTVGSSTFAVTAATGAVACGPVTIRGATGSVILRRQSDSTVGWNVAAYSGALNFYSYTTGTVLASINDSTGAVAITGALTGVTTGAFSDTITVTKTSAVGAINITAGTGTNGAAIQCVNTGGSSYFGRNNSTGGAFGGTAYATVVYSGGAYPLQFFTNDTLALTIASGGAITLSAQPAFVAGSKYLVIDASGNVRVSALGPAS